MDKFNSVFPAKVFRPRPQSHPKDLHKNRPTLYGPTKSWYTPELGRLRNLMLTVNDFFKAEANPTIKQKYFLLYSKIKNDYRVKVTEAKRKYSLNKILNAPNPCKAAWDVVNESRTPCPGPEILLTPDDFNNFFVSVADQVLSDIPMLQTDPLDSVTDLTTALSFNRWKPVSTNHIISIVKKFKSSVSQDVDGLSTNIVKSTIDIIAVPLTYLVNKCLMEGIFPDKLKIARTIPVYKKGNPSIASNFRPISILPAFSKVFETVMKNQLVAYLEANNILADAQHGFREKRSTTSAL